MKRILIFCFYFFLHTTFPLQASIEDLCEARDQEEVKRLIEKEKVDVNSRLEHGLTALHFACLQGRGEIARLLLEKGAYVNVRDNDGWTPLHYVCYYGKKELAKLLLEKGAYVNVRDNDGITPLHLAWSCGHKELAEFLIEKDADEDDQDWYGRTQKCFKRFWEEGFFWFSAIMVLAFLIKKIYNKHKKIDPFDAFRKIAESGNQEKINAAFSECIELENGKAIEVLYGGANENSRVTWMETIVDRKKESLLPIFNLDFQENFLFRLARENKKNRAQWILEKVNFPKSAKEKTLYTALKEKNKDFLELFDEETKMSVLRQNIEEDEISDFFSKDEFRKALGQQKKITKSQLREGLECCICQCVFNDPVETKYGHNYCRECILNCIDASNTCPQTRQPLYPGDVFPCSLYLKNRLDNYKRQYPDSD